MIFMVARFVVHPMGVAAAPLTHRLAIRAEAII
jgi:hypothetical protein